MILIIALLMGFTTVIVGTPYAAKYLNASGIVAVDQQKEDKPRLPTAGGIPVLFGFLIAVTSYLAISSFFENSGFGQLEVLAALNSVFIIALIGLLDDIHINIEAFTDNKTATNDIINPLEAFRLKILELFPVEIENPESIIREGLGQATKMLFVLPAALPLIAVGAGSWTMTVPLFDIVINWGLIYPLLLLPLGLLFVSNVVNMLAGTNGLSASLGFVTSTSLGIVGLISGSTEAALIAFSLSATLLAFLRYNFYPASILPGDSLTYLTGAAMFSAMVIGNMEKFGAVIFGLWYLEFLLKMRSGFQAHSWGVLKDGELVPRHEKTYSLTHPLMRRGYSEKQITVILTMLQTLICLAGLFLYIQGWL